MTDVSRQGKTPRHRDRFMIASITPRRHDTASSNRRKRKGWDGLTTHFVHVEIKKPV